jgi:hypothetical protein
MFESFTTAFQEAPADPNAWYVFPRDATGLKSYIVRIGDEQLLGRDDILDRGKNGNWDGQQAGDRVALDQCSVEIAKDGTHAILHALGTRPTGYRSGSFKPWTWLQPGESTKMEHFWKISMNENEPEEVVYRLGDGYLLQEEQQRRQQQRGRGSSNGGQWQHEGEFVSTDREQ